MSIMEHSHRGKAYEAVHNEAIALVRELLGVPDDYHVLFLQGGASQQFAMVPMNLLEPARAPTTSSPAAGREKAYQGGQDARQGARRGHAPSRTASSRASPSRSELELDAKAAYVHMTSNNTLFGTQWHGFPDTGAVPLVADMSSDIVWRPIDVAKFGLIYAGAQKNLGPERAWSLVIVRRRSSSSAARKTSR